MRKSGKKGRYDRLYKQIVGLFAKQGNGLSRMSTVAAVLHHKMEEFFWTGFYLLDGDELIVGPYQGPVACQHLEKGRGVCWASIQSGESIVVPDVHQFPGHIACDPRSKSEIVVPLRDREGKIIGVLDVDSKNPDAFDEDDREGLERILALLTENL
jgi:L-methionine (R)-S-oxide reductase